MAVRLAWELDMTLPEMLHCLSCLMSLPAWLLRKVNDHLQPCIIRCGAQASVFPRTVTYTVPSTLPFPLLVSKLWVPPRGIKKGLPARPCSAWPAQMPPMKVPASSELHGLELPNYALPVFSGKWFLCRWVWDFLPVVHKALESINDAVGFHV